MSEESAGTGRPSWQSAAPALIVGSVVVLGTVAVVLWANGFRFESLLDDKKLNSVLGVAATAVGTVLKIARGARRAPVTEENLDSAVGRLAERVGRRYRTEAGNLGLLGPSMGVRWRTSTGDDEGDVAGLPRVFRSLPRARLVVLGGGSGTGKTSAGLLLALDHRPGSAVPVLVTVDDWDPERQPLVAWLAERLEADFEFLRDGRYGGAVARRLIDNGHLLPIFDGLDDGDRIRALIDFMNRRNASPDDPDLDYVVLIDEHAYRSHTRRHPCFDAPHVRLEGVTSDAAVGYLRLLVPDTTGDKARRRDDLIEAVREYPGLRTPLVLSFLERLVYTPGYGPVPADPSGVLTLAAELRTPGRTAALRLVARRMRDQGLTSLRLTHLQALIERQPGRRAAARIGLPAVVGAAAGALICGSLALAGQVLDHDFRMNTGVGALFGAVCGLAAGLVSEQRGRGTSSGRRFALGNAVAAGAVTAFVLLFANPAGTSSTAILYGLATLAITGLLSSPPAPWARRTDAWFSPLGFVATRVNPFITLGVGLAVGGGLTSTGGWEVGLPAGLLVGLGFGYLDRASFRTFDAPDPYRALRVNGTHALINAAVFGAAMGVPLLFFYGHRDSAIDGTFRSWAEAILIAAGAWFAGALAFWWGTDDRVRVAMVARQLPADVDPALLREARAARLLRADGHAYTFWHHRLQDALAGSPAAPVFDLEERSTVA